MSDMNTLHDDAAAVDDTDRSIWSWCVKEITFWQSRSVDYQHALEKFAEYNETRAETYMYRICGGQVSIAPKPSTLSDHGLGRATHYRDFVQSVVRALCPELDTTIAIDIGDGGLITAEVPVFVFQKQPSAPGLLFPDIDFLLGKFYEDARYPPDPMAFDEKSCSAMFVGSTTGVNGITTRSVVDLIKGHVSERTAPRLRAGVYFTGNPNVEFLIPHLTQCESPETEDLLRTLGFGSNVRIPWDAHFRHKFIISMDGNGATCSRVLLALRSNSVLLKYTSPHHLYYFSGLMPWTHYIPIESDEEVNHIVRAEQQRPGFFRHVAEQGQAFANRYLTRLQVMKYTAWLLRMYASSFDASSAAPWRLGAAVADFRRSAISAIRILAHISLQGDVWFEQGAWVGASDKRLTIEGFAVEPGVAFTAADISYQAMFSDGSLTDRCQGGEFCGTRGKALPICGLRVRLSGAAADSYDCSYCARFADGTEVSCVKGGEICQAESRAPIVGLRITWCASENGIWRRGDRPGPGDC
jgi:hypothetical protein